MKKIKILIVIFSLYFIFVSIIYADAKGKVSGLLVDFLPSARSRSLGGAVSAFRNSPDAIHFNTASAAFNEHTIFSYSNHQLYQNIKFNNFSYITNYSDNLIYGINLKTMSTPRIDKTRVVPGSFLKYNNEGSFQQKDIALTYGMAYKFDGKIKVINTLFDFSYGGNIKILSSKIDIYETIGYTTDWSIFFSKEDFSFSLSVLNLFGRLKYLNEKERMPLSSKFGFYFPVKIFNVLSNFTIDFTKLSGNNHFFNIGHELEILNGVFIRNGFDSRNQAGSGYNFGFGITLTENIDLVHSICLNYSYSSYGDLGNVSSFDISVLF